MTRLNHRAIPFFLLLIFGLSSLALGQPRIEVTRTEKDSIWINVGSDHGVTSGMEGFVMVELQGELTACASFEITQVLALESKCWIIREETTGWDHKFVGKTVTLKDDLKDVIKVDDSIQHQLESAKNYLKLKKIDAAITIYKTLKNQGVEKALFQDDYDIALSFKKVRDEQNKVHVLNKEITRLREQVMKFEDTNIDKAISFQEKLFSTTNNSIDEIKLLNLNYLKEKNMLPRNFIPKDIESILKKYPKRGEELIDTALKHAEGIERTRQQRLNHQEKLKRDDHFDTVIASEDRKKLNSYLDLFKGKDLEHDLDIKKAIEAIQEKTLEQRKEELSKLTDMGAVTQWKESRGFRVKIPVSDSNKSIKGLFNSENVKTIDFFYQLDVKKSKMHQITLKKNKSTFVH